MHDDASARGRSLSPNLLLAATALLSAWLLFQVQPMVAKRMLPWFGGGAAVWTTAMLFFQAALFVGYLYAHLVARALPPRQQVLLHVGLLAMAAVSIMAFGVFPTAPWRAEVSNRPALGILAALAGSVGLPYLVLAATAPLVQVWFARANPGRSPYRLYAISNVGSLAALVSYPFAVEPNLGLSRQGAVWSGLFVAFAAMCALSGLLSLGVGRAAPREDSDVQRADLSAAEPAEKPRYLFWLALPACASILLLAVTSYLTQHLAPIPLLWILPLVVYLLSFILTFDSDRWYRRWFWMPLAAVCSFTAVLSWLRSFPPPVTWMVGLHITLLLAAAMVCHGELVRMRPPARGLTAYYLCIAAGGALGGLFVSVVAPLAFDDHYELHFGVLLAWVLAVAALVVDRRSPFYRGGRRGARAGLAGCLVLMLVLTAAMAVDIHKQRRGVIAAGRNFYGALQVARRNEGSPRAYLQLFNGQISHGSQFADSSMRRIATSYYHDGSGVGRAFTELKPQPLRRVGVVGLGAGTLAAYAKSGDSFQFYEINPQVIDFAERRFSYLRDARGRGAEIAVHHGDARLVLEHQQPQRFDVLVLDAFNGDAIPTHLLTMEAFDVYLRHLAEDGVLAVHISNLYLDLEAVMQAAAERYGLEASNIVTEADAAPGAMAANWVLLHRREGYFAQRRFGFNLRMAPEAWPPVPWTDEYTNVLEVLSW
jgi:protein-L-isoaspartate O-methyltransferase